MTHGFRIALIATALLPVLGMTGCTMEHEVGAPADSGKQIVFAPSIETGEAASRAASGHPLGETATEIPDGSAFGMYAYHSALGDGTDLTLFTDLANQKVTRDGSKFTYSPVVNWPGLATSKLAFFGYYPWTDQTGTPNPAVTMDAVDPKMTIAYTVPSSPAQHIDLMYTRKGLTAGYNPVSVVFGHALTWLRFSASAKDYDEPVRITKITVKNAQTKGTLTVLDTGVPVWTLTSDKTDYGLTAAGGGLTGSVLTDAMTPVDTPAGQMLVLPQQVGGMTLEVEATVGGVAFPEPFVFPLVGSDDWQMNRIVTYRMALANDQMTLATQVDDWTPNGVDVIYDGQWQLSLTKGGVEFGSKGGTATLTAATNYDVDRFGYPAGLQFDVADIEYSGAGGWLTVEASGTNGDLSRTLTFTAQDNEAARYQSVGYPSERTATVRLRAGNLTKVIKVVQEKYLVSPEFSRSNIVLYIDVEANRILTFAETEADHTSKTVNYVSQHGDDPRSVTFSGMTALKANLQGIHFRWGSLVGLSSTCEAVEKTTFDGMNDVKFWPVEYEETCIARNGRTPDLVTWKFSQTAAEWQDADQVPFLGDPAIANTTITYDAFKGKYSSLGYDAAAAYGDICRYISGKGWVEGQWRMPTRREMELLDNETEAAGKIGSGYGVMFGTYSSGTSWTRIAMENPINLDYYGFTPVTNAYMLGGGVTAADAGNVDYLSYGGDSRVLLPAAGNRHFHDGNQYNPGFNGLYWGCTPGGTVDENVNAGFLWINGGGFDVSAYNSRSYGCSVRCIRVGVSE